MSGLWTKPSSDLTKAMLSTKTSPIDHSLSATVTKSIAKLADENKKNITFELSSYDYSQIANKSINRTEFMSSIGLMELKKKSSEFKDLNQISERRLSKTGLFIEIIKT